MLPSNGRPSKQRYNYHMTLDELSQLLHFVKLRYDSKWRVYILLSFGLGLRASEAAATNMHDFEDDYRFLNYRAAKTNKQISREPVPEVVRGAIKEYIRLNAHRLRDGYLFPKHSGEGDFVKTETIGAYWCKWRKGCAKYFNNPRWLDVYDVNGSNRHRIGSHSLRRLHRTYLAKQLNNDFIVSKITHYDDIKSFTIYRNEFELMETRDKLILPVMNPIIERLDSEVKIVPNEQTDNTATIEAKPIPYSTRA